MMRPLLFAFVSLVTVLAGCSRVREVRGPDDEQAFDIQCRKMSGCVKEAEKICGAGGYVVQSSTSYDMTVSCKNGERDD